MRQRETSFGIFKRSNLQDHKQTRLECIKETITRINWQIHDYNERFYISSSQKLMGQSDEIIKI